MSQRVQKPFVGEENIKVKNEIMSMLKLGVIRQVDRSYVKFFSPIFAVPKKDGSFRIILNLKKLNESVEYSYKLCSKFIVSGERPINKAL